MTSCPEAMVLRIWRFWKRVSWEWTLDHVGRQLGCLPLRQVFEVGVRPWNWEVGSDHGVENLRSKTRRDVPNVGVSLAQVRARSCFQVGIDLQWNVPSIQCAWGTYYCRWAALLSLLIPMVPKTFWLLNKECQQWPIPSLTDEQS